MKTSTTKKPALHPSLVATLSYITIAACNSDQAASPSSEEVGVASSAYGVDDFVEPEEEEDGPGYNLSSGQWAYVSQDSQADPTLYATPELAGASFLRTRYPEFTLLSTYYEGFRSYSCSSRRASDGTQSVDWCANSVLKCPANSTDIGTSYCQCNSGYAADGDTCVSRAVWNPTNPEKRFPSPLKGTWLGAEGDSEFKPSDPEGTFGIPPGSTIRFVRGRADLSRYGVSLYDGMKSIIGPMALTGDKSDIPMGITALRTMSRWFFGHPATPQMIINALANKGLDLHHYDCTLQVVPRKLHRALAHRGSAYDIRNKLLTCP